MKNDMKISVETVAQAYLEMLRNRGIKYIFGNSGTDFAPIIDGLAKFIVEKKTGVYFFLNSKLCVRCVGFLKGKDPQIYIPLLYLFKFLPREIPASRSSKHLQLIPLFGKICSPALGKKLFGILFLLTSISNRLLNRLSTGLSYWITLVHYRLAHPPPNE